ncbi:WD40 repeat-like protein [Vararia minispora EC-137]|uniref:WD40 repeat-like protein n=1 Tax=Vararia minispora EC-137 TaxID=1314806 RepID=A0ACB8Q8E7_9AGAM|nr:WD40 repeat-like protein [Vararia minispora EC-137]
MPDIPFGSQIFDLAFHPTASVVYTGQLTGHIAAFSYNDETGAHTERFTHRPSKRSCRGLQLNEDGSRLWTVGKAKCLHALDTSTGELVETRESAHEVPINRITRCMQHLLATGDDDGVIKLWDPRKEGAVRTYTQHFDFISDFAWLEDKKQLVATSGDGTLSVMDVRAKKTEPSAQSEDQEDELLSILPIKGGSKVVVGTQLGILSVFNRKKGWGDCVDRVPGHPHSIDALCALPSSYPSSSSTILTGSSDGLLRAVELFPTRLIGVIADHGEFPIERIAIDRAGEGHWVGSVGHDEVLRMTDLREVFEDEDGNEKENTEEREASSSDGEGDEAEPRGAQASLKRAKEDSDEVSQKGAAETDAHSDVEDSDEGVKEKRKKRRKKDKLSGREAKRGKNEVEADKSFFSGL